MMFVCSYLLLKTSSTITGRNKMMNTPDRKHHICHHNSNWITYLNLPRNLLIALIWKEFDELHFRLVRLEIVWCLHGLTIWWDHKITYLHTWRDVSCFDYAAYHFVNYPRKQQPSMMSFSVPSCLSYRAAHTMMQDEVICNWSSFSAPNSWTIFCQLPPDPNCIIISIS